MKLPKQKANPKLKELAGTIREAMRQRQLDVRGLTAALGMTNEQRGAVANWVTGKNGPNGLVRPKLAEILGVPEDRLTAPTRGGGRTVSNFKAPSDVLGPAQRAVALVQTRQQSPEILQGPPPATDVFVIRARSDGSMQVRLDANVPFAKGTQLVQFLLNFGLVAGADTE